MTKTKAELQAALDTLQGKYDELANAIRNGVPYTQMTRMVGASEEENAQADEYESINRNAAIRGYSRCQGNSWA
jgi:hypothetical protein